MGRKKRTGKDVMLAKGFGRRLRKLRDERSLSQSELARAIGSETAHISRYERGVVMPNAESLLELATFLRVDVGFLLTGQESGQGQGDDLPIHDLSLLERFRDLEKLSRKDREVIITIIDALLSTRDHEEVTARRARKSA